MKATWCTDRLASSAVRILVIVLVSAMSVPAAAQAGDANAVFHRTFGDAFLDQYWKLHTDGAVTNGYYRVARELNVPDAHHRAALADFLRQNLARLDAIPAGSLEAPTRTDREMLRNQLALELWSLEEFGEWQWNPSWYNIADPFELLLVTEYAPLDERLRTIGARLARVPDFYAAALRNLRNPTHEHTQLAIEQSLGSLPVLGEELDAALARSHLAAGERHEIAQRAKQAREAIQGFVEGLRALEASRAPGSARSFRIGKELYERKFAFEIASGSTAEALYQRALQEKEHLLDRMDVLADELWPKVFPNEARPADRLDKIGGVIRKLSEQHIARGDLFAEVQRRIPELEQWIESKGLLTLDLQKPLQVRVTPPYKQGAPRASIDPPGPYDPGAPTYFNVTPIDDLNAERAESFLREYNRWVLPVLVIHEAVPGHYVQLVYANKSPSLIKSLFANGAMVEGWAVYSERMMLESGYGEDTAEQWLLYSKWNLRSVCNTILDYSVHVLGMTEDDAKRFLSREAFQSDEEVRGKWRRVTLTSVQLTSYFAGYSAIYDLRERRKAELGPRFDLKRFHEKFLSYGSAPVGAIEALMESEAPQDQGAEGR
jgi:uncharacterized protein (DUF885 family)